MTEPNRNLETVSDIRPHEPPSGRKPVANAGGSASIMLSWLFGFLGIFAMALGAMLFAAPLMVVGGICILLAVWFYIAAQQERITSRTR